MLSHSEYVKILIGLIAIVNPLGAMPIFIGLTDGLAPQARARIANIVALTVSIILLVALFIGEILLGLFGITIDSFRVGGGILIMLMAISMMHARISPTVQTREEAEESKDRESVAVVPLSMPLLAGPGAISTVILDAHKGTGPAHYGIIAAAILLVALLLRIVLRLSPFLARRLTATGINIFTRIMGLILAAIAVEFIANGLKGLFPVLHG